MIGNETNKTSLELQPQQIKIEEVVNESPAAVTASSLGMVPQDLDSQVQAASNSDQPSFQSNANPILPPKADDQLVYFTVFCFFLTF